jgi:hypothetical protein
LFCRASGEPDYTPWVTHMKAESPSPLRKP